MNKIMITALFGALALTNFMNASFKGIDLNKVMESTCKSKKTGEIRVARYGLYQTPAEGCRRLGEDFVPVEGAGSVKEMI